MYEKIFPTEIEFEAVADPGFPGGRQLPRGVHQFLFCKGFAKQLYENERIWTKTGIHPRQTYPPTPPPQQPLDLPLQRLK